MPQQCKFKGFVFIFLLFFLTFNVTARDNNDIDDCISGETGNLKIRIIEPDESENFELGETIDIEVEVANLGDKTRDVVVEVSLYNVDEENTISQEDSDDERLSPGEDENFDIEFKIPTKARGIDNDDEFILFVKAFDEDSEKGACEEEAVDIDLEFEDEAVNIDSVKLLPSVVECGKIATLITEVSNIGEENLEDVEIKVRNDRLNLNKISNSFDLDELGDEDDEFVSKLDLLIPKKAVEGSYNLDIDVIFDGETENDNVILEVECKETIDSRTSNKTSEVLLVVGSDKSSKPIEPVQVIKVGEISTLFLVDFVLLLFLIFLIVVLVKL